MEEYYLRDNRIIYKTFNNYLYYFYNHHWILSGYDIRDLSDPRFTFTSLPPDDPIIIRELLNEL